MPPEPKRPIEELLEASAKARRAEFGADPGMPNPIRARLHEEIARMNTTAEPHPRRSWFALFWPQISIATAVAAALVTASVMWLGHKSDSDQPSMKLAMNEARNREMTAAPADALRSLDSQSQIAAQPITPPATSDSESVKIAETLSASTLGEKAAAIRADENTNAIQKFAEVKVPAGSSPVEALEKAGGDEGKALAMKTDKSEAEVASALAVPAENAPAQRFAARAASAPLGGGKDEPAKNSNAQQRFSQTTRGQALRSNANVKQQAPNILENFEVEQNGREIRLVDADGSTYVGKFEPVARTSGARMLKMKDAAPAPAAAAAPATVAKSENAQSEQFFRASGINNSLKKRVVFEGNYIALPAVETKASAAKSKQSNDASQAPARIIGTAKVPGEPPVEVDAATVAR